MKRKVVSGIMLTLLLFGMLALAFNIQSVKCTQPLEIEWSRTYGGHDSDMAYSVVQTSDREYAITGLTYSFGVGNSRSDFWLVKANSTGYVQWNKTYGGAHNDEAFSVIQTSDGGYVLTGRTRSFDSGYSRLWLVKTDSSGNMQWNKTYGEDNQNSEGWGVIETNDTGYIVAGSTREDLWLVKTDSSGNMQWNKTYGREPSTEKGPSLIKTNDGGYAMVGMTRDYLSGNEWDFFLVKVDPSGNLEWNQTYGGTSHDHGNALIQTSDGGYALAGYTYSFGIGGDFWLIKTNSSGHMLWNKTYGGEGSESAHSVMETTDRGYLLTGRTTSFGAGSGDFWLVKTDSIGNQELNKTYGGAGNEYALSSIETHDGGYAIVGWTSSFGAGSWDFWLVKISPETHGQAVGGISIPVNKLELLAPYIGLAILLAVAVVTVGYVKKRKRHIRVNS